MGGEHKKINLDEVELAIDGPSDDLITLDEALEKLSQKDKIKADLVKLRYFAGLTIKQAAEFLGISLSTANEYWAYAKVWLLFEIKK